MDLSTQGVSYKFVSNTAQQNIRKKRRQITLIEKKDMIELYEQGYSHQDIANRYNIGRSTVTKILLSNNSLSLINYPTVKQKRKLIVEDKLNVLEKGLLERCFDMINGNESFNYILKHGIKQEDIISTSLQIADELDMKCFKGNTSWFNKFRKKYKINIKENGMAEIGEDYINLNNAANNYGNYVHSEYTNHPLIQLNNVNFVDLCYPTTSIISPTLMLPNNLDFSSVTSPDEMYTYENVQDDVYFSLPTQEFDISFSYQNTNPF